MEKISIAQVAAFTPKFSEAQMYAAEMLLDRPDMSLPDDQELDRLLECQNLPENLYGQGFGFDEVYGWFWSVLSSINWWRSMANYAFEKPGYGNHDEREQRPGFEERRRELSGLLANVLSAYAAANEEDAIYWLERGPGVALVELMRRYRLYTRQVEALLFDVWPDINRNLLTKPEFFKGPSAGTGKPYIELVA